MGIDIYAKWKDQSEAETKAQYTGFDTTAGKVGYLREAYHGGPYVTHFLFKECWDDNHEMQIPAETLRERLPSAVLLAMFRNQKVYGKEKHPENLGDVEDGALETLKTKLDEIFKNEVADASHEIISKQFDEKSLAHAKVMIEGGILPDYAQSFVDFVELCERKEKETGEPCTIIASY